MAQNVTATLKRCRSCHESKKESEFRYIKYFKKYRSTCKKCESLARQRRKRNVEKHVEQFGVTPGILKRIHRETSEQAGRQAKESVFKNVSQIGKVMYYVSKIALWGCYYVLFPVTVLLVAASALALSKRVPDDLLDLLAPYGITLAITAFLYKFVKSIDREIASQRDSIRGRLYREALLKRIEYENFYRSAEWRILRQTFLRSQKKPQGRYVCHFCTNTIWRERDVTVDHIKPRSKFPELAMSVDNLLLACRQCNATKGSKLLSDEEFQVLLDRSKEIHAQATQHKTG